MATSKREVWLVGRAGPRPTEPYPDHDLDPVPDELPDCEYCDAKGKVPPVRREHGQTIWLHGTPAHDWMTCPACGGSGVKED